MRYKGQTLAILMVILVAVFVIALGIYSQIVRNQERIFKERTSKETASFTDTLTESMQGASVDVLFNNLEAQSCFDTGCCYNNIEDVQEILDVDLSLIDPNEIEENFEVCFTKKRTVSEPELMLKEKTITIPMARNVGACSYLLELSGTGGIVLRKVYVKYDASGQIIAVKPYDYSDIIGVKADPLLAGDYGLPVWSAVPTAFDNSAVDGYDLLEVEMFSLEDGIYYKLSEMNGCSNYFATTVQVTTTQDGISQSSYFDIPKAKTLDPIFDYVLYNNYGGDSLRYRKN